VTIMAWDSDADGKLTREDFINFYKDSCFQKINVVRTNLTHHNYRHDLKQAPKQGDNDNVL